MYNWYFNTVFFCGTLFVNLKKLNDISVLKPFISVWVPQFVGVKYPKWGGERSWYGPVFGSCCQYSARQPSITTVKVFTKASPIVQQCSCFLRQGKRKLGGVTRLAFKTNDVTRCTPRPPPARACAKWALSIL